MITLFHLFEFLGPVLGIVVGGIAGALHFGFFGGLAGALAGGIIGRVCGHLPLRLTNRAIFRDLRRKSTEELWASLHDGTCQLPNCFLLELRWRGEDMGKGLRLTLAMLVSENRDRRLRGWAALMSVFPDVADRIDDYRPDAPADVRRAVVGRLEESAAAG